MGAFETKSASSPLVDFGWLNVNTIKDLTFFLSVKQEIGYLIDAYWSQNDVLLYKQSS